MPGKLVHFDIPVEDVPRAVDFYGFVMGWKIYKYDTGGAAEGPEYWLVQFDPDDPESGGGGIAKKEMPQQAPMNYYDAEGGLDAFNQRVKDRGGTIVIERMPVPTMGYFSVCIDPEGNPFGGWQTDPEAKME